MYSYEVQLLDLDLLEQSSRSQYIKIELLSHDKKTVLDEIQGLLISDNFSADGSSATRRTYSATFFVSDAGFFSDRNARIWIDRYVRVYYGLLANAINDAPTYYTIGTFSFSSLTYTFNASTKTLSINCLDMMADYDGTKGGVVPTSEWETEIDPSTTIDRNKVVVNNATLLAERVGKEEGQYIFQYNGTDWEYDNTAINLIHYGILLNEDVEPNTNDIVAINLILGRGTTLIIYKIDPATITPLFPDGVSTSIYLAVESSVLAAGITDYELHDIKKLLPHDLEFNSGATWKDVWQGLCDLYPDWEFFFDEYGKFIWRQIPTAYIDPRLIDSSVLEPIVISETINDDYSKVHNATEIWGAVLDLSNNDRYAFFNLAAFTTELTTKGFAGLDEQTMDHLKDIETGHTNLYNARQDNNITLYLDILFGRTATYPNPLVPTVVINGDTIEVNLPYGLIPMEKMEDFGNLSSLAIRLPGTGIYQGTLKYIKINNFEKVPIYDAAGNGIANNTLFAGQVYVFRFRLTANGGLVTLALSALEGNGILAADGITYTAKTKALLDVIRLSLVYDNTIVYKQDNVYMPENYPSNLQFFTEDNLKDLNWYLQGSGQCFGKYSEEGNSYTDDIIYSVPNVGYEILLVKDYSQLTDNDACKELAEYDTYSSCVKQDTITISTIIIPWLEPHQKILYRVKLTGEVSDWLIKNISWNTESGTMSITMYRFIQDFQYIWDKKYSKYYTLICRDFDDRILDENDYKEGEGNLVEYSTAMTPFFLVTPIKTYYDFIGWTGQYLRDKGYSDNPQTRVIIAEKTKGNLDFKANWLPTTYNIKYYYTNTFDSDIGITTELTTDAWFANPGRVLTYNYESANFTLVNANQRDYYNFNGWVGEGQEIPSMSLIVPHNSNGDKKFYAIYTPIEYNLTFREYSDHSTIILTDNPATFNYETPSFSLVPPIKRGYSFLGWSQYGVLPEVVNSRVTIAKGSHDARIYEAHWTPAIYTISYNIDAMQGGIAKQLYIGDGQYSADRNIYPVNIIKNPTRVFYPDPSLIAPGSTISTGDTEPQHTFNNNITTYKANSPDTVLNAPVLKGAAADEYIFIGWRDLYTSVDPEHPEQAYELQYHIPPVDEEKLGDLLLFAGWRDSQGNIIE